MCKHFIYLFLLATPVFLLAQTRNLDFYLEAGLARSPVFGDLQNQALTNALDSQKIVAAQLPAINGVGQVMLAPTYKGWGYDQAISNGGNYSALVTVTQPLFNQKTLATQFAALDVQNRTLVAAANLTRHDLRFNITAAYITAFGDYRQLVFEQETLAQMREQEAVLKQLVTPGIYRPTDFLNFQNSVLGQQVTVQQATLKWHDDLNALNLLCGISDTAEATLEAPALPIPAAAFNPDSSVFLQTFAVDSLAIRNRRQQTDDAYRWKVEWFADGGLNTSVPKRAYQNFGFSGGVNVSKPIFDGRQRDLEFQKLDIADDTRRRYRGFNKSQIALQISQLRARLAETDALIAQMQSQSQSAKNLLSIYREQLNKGTASVTDLLLAVQNYKVLENNLRQMEVAKWLIINELNYRSQ